MATFYFLGLTLTPQGSEQRRKSIQFFKGDVLGYYERIETLDGVSMKISCSAERMLTTPAWNDEDAYPPLAPRYALNIANSRLKQFVLSPEQWSLRALELRQETFTERWYYKATYHLRRKTSFPPQLGIYVLMDGSVVEPAIDVEGASETIRRNANEGASHFSSHEIAAAYDAYQEIVDGKTKEDVTRILGQPELVIHIGNARSSWLYPLPLSDDQAHAQTRSYHVQDVSQALDVLRSAWSTERYEQGFILVDLDEEDAPVAKHFNSSDHSIAESLDTSF